MKLIHLSDLHLGKRVNGFSMLEDQRYILQEILRIIREEQPQAVLLAGDIYDKSVPPAEAVRLFDDFLAALAQLYLEVFIISGNHDSPERIAFGGRLMDKSGIHVSPVYDGHVTPISLTDDYGRVDFTLLPFLKPAHVRQYFPDQTIGSYTEAMAAAISAVPLDPAVRNVLVTHQFVTGASRCESEELVVGGTDNVDVRVFAPFDYVALGHLHGPQSVSRETVRYCGTPLKYSFSEVHHHKSVTVTELKEKGDISIRTVPLTPLRDLHKLRGTYQELTSRSFYDGTAYPSDYVHITLTDEDDVPNALGKLQTIYHGLMQLCYDNHRTRNQTQLDGPENARQKDPLTLLAEFYEKQNGQPMSGEQQDLARRLIEEIREELE